MRLRTWPTAIVGVLAALCLAACSGGSGGNGPFSDTGSVTPVSTPSATDPSSPSSSATSSTPSSPPTSTQVPVDQIPPGHPSSWIPAGVPLTAKYARPGQKPPVFTPAVFQHTDAGARAMLHYIVAAEDWAFASLDATPVLIVCKAVQCTDLESAVAQNKQQGLHQVGPLHEYSSYEILKSKNVALADVVGRVQVYSRGGATVDSTGKVIYRSKPLRITNEFYLKWNGQMWYVNGQGTIR